MHRLHLRDYWRSAPWGVVAVMVIMLYAMVALAVSCGWQQQTWSQLNGGRWDEVSVQHWWGTNMVGQDIFARAMVSTRTSFVIGLQAMVGALLLGTALGSVAGNRHRGWLDATVLWLAAVFDAIPFYLMAVAVAFAFQHSQYAVVIALVLSFWTTTARLVRAEVLRLRGQDFVAAARMAGVPGWMVVWRHLLPNASAVVLIQGVIIFVAAVKAEVLLSFIGLGVHDTISWGVMLAESTQEVPRGELNNFLAASLLLSLLVLALNLLADSLQDWLDPRHSHSRGADGVV